MHKDIFSGKIKSLIILLTILAFAYFIVTVFVLIGLRLRLALIWNMFLAALPLVFAVVLVKVVDTHKIPAALLSILWLLFFPNAPYMLTDLIHLSLYTYYAGGFVADIVAWSGFLHILTGVILGALFGYTSLFMLQGAVSKYWGKTAGWLFVCCVSALSGAAIYIGRFARLNSWDALLNPGAVFEGLASMLNSTAVGMALIFTVMTIVPYTIFYFCLCDVPGEKGKESLPDAI